MKSLIITILLMLSFSIKAYDYSDSASELEIKLLVEQGGFQEAIDYLSKVAPLKRSPEWGALANESFSKLIERNIASGNFHDNIDLGSVIKSRFPFLLKNSHIMSGIFKSGLLTNPSCNSRFDNECMSIFGYSLAFNPNGPEMAALLVDNNRNQISGDPLDLILLYEIAAKTQLEKICSDDKLKNSVSLAASKNNDIYRDIISRIVTQSCSDFMFESLEDNLHRNETIQNNMCKPMSITKQLGRISLMVCKERGLI